jgi:integrase
MIKRDWAKGRYHIAEENPWKDMGRRFGRQPKNKLDPFDLDEVNSILTGFRSNPEFSHYADFVAFLIGIGCRIGEGIGIRWANVAKDFTSVYICEAISKGVVGNTKTKESRDVAIPPSVWPQCLNAGRNHSSPNHQIWCLAVPMDTQSIETISVQESGQRC